MENGISLVIPAYQEEENLRFLLPEIHKVLKETRQPYEIIVVDTCRPMDHTEELCRTQNALCIRCLDNDNYGNAVRAGINQAQYDKTVFMDGDDFHRPVEIPQMPEAMEKEKPDLVIGSRYVAGGTSSNGVVLELLSVILNWVFRWTFHLSVKDLSGSFRMYRTEQLRKTGLEMRQFRYNQGDPDQALHAGSIPLQGGSDQFFKTPCGGIQTQSAGFHRRISGNNHPAEAHSET